MSRPRIFLHIVRAFEGVDDGHFLTAAEISKRGEPSGRNISPRGLTIPSHGASAIMSRLHYALGRPEWARLMMPGIVAEYSQTKGIGARKVALAEEQLPKPTLGQKGVCLKPDCEYNVNYVVSHRGKCRRDVESCGRHLIWTVGLLEKGCQHPGHPDQAPLILDVRSFAAAKKLAVALGR